MSNIKIKRSRKLIIQTRDISILKFLDRVGYANIKQTDIATGGNGDEKSHASILRRLYLLRRFGYLKAFSTHQGAYYALDKVYQGENAPIRGVKLDQLDHHDFLIELFLLVQNEHVLSERECITEFKVVGKKGKVPDMVINNWIIEFERTNKSVAGTKAVIDYWTSVQSKKLCVIYESEQIKNRYTALLNPRVKLLAREQYRDILSILGVEEQYVNVGDSGEQKFVISSNDEYIESIRNKYL